MPAGWLYIMTNRPNGTLYVGATTQIAKRAWEHREGVADGFTKRYGLTRLVYVEAYADIMPHTYGAPHHETKLSA